MCELSLVSCAFGVRFVSSDPLRDDAALSQLLPDPDPVVPERLQGLLRGRLGVRFRVHAGDDVREDPFHRELGLDAGLSRRVKVGGERGLLHAKPLPLVRHRARGSVAAGVKPGEVERASALSQGLEQVVDNGCGLEGLAALLGQRDSLDGLAFAEALVGNLPRGRRTLAPGLVHRKLPPGSLHDPQVHLAGSGISARAGGCGGDALQPELSLALSDERREGLDTPYCQARAAEAFGRDWHSVCDVLGQERGHDRPGSHAQLRRGFVPPPEHPSQNLAAGLRALRLAGLVVVSQHAHPPELRIERGSGARVQLGLRHGADVNAGVHQLLDFLVSNLRSLALGPGDGFGDREDDRRQLRLVFLSLSRAAQRAHDLLRDGLSVRSQGEGLVRGVRSFPRSLGDESLSRELLHHVLRRILTPGLPGQETPREPDMLERTLGPLRRHPGRGLTVRGERRQVGHRGASAPEREEKREENRRSLGAHIPPKSAAPAVFNPLNNATAVIARPAHPSPARVLVIRAY